MYLTSRCDTITACLSGAVKLARRQRGEYRTVPLQRDGSALFSSFSIKYYIKSTERGANAVEY